MRRRLEVSNQRQAVFPRAQVFFAVGPAVDFGFKVGLAEFEKSKRYGK